MTAFGTKQSIKKPTSYLPQAIPHKKPQHSGWGLYSAYYC